VPAPQTQGQPSLTAASTLRTEQLGDGRSNCLEKAVGLARPGDSIILMSDSKDGVGHALVRRPDGSVVDPNHPTVRYETLGQWQAMNPRYTQPVAVPASQVKQVLSTPPGEQRDALLGRLGLSGVANRQVADSEPQWKTPKKEVLNIRVAPSDGTTQIRTQKTAGDKLKVVGQNEDGTWLKVELPHGATGWVLASLVVDTEAPPPQRFADWLMKGTQPPFMDPAEWDALGTQGQAQFIQGAREHAMGKGWPQPDFTRPPSIDAMTWSHLPADVQQTLFQQQWQAAVEERTKLFFEGPPPGGKALETPYSGMDSELGWGQVGQWLLYGAKPGAPAQYLKLSKVFGEGEWHTKNNNLCGPLAVAPSLDMTPLEALTAFRNSNDPVSEEILADDLTTMGGQLGRVFEARGWTQGYQYGQQTPPEDMARLLSEGKQLLTLVNIDTLHADGMLRSYTDGEPDETNVAHWVNVRAVEQAADGSWMVRVYNPFENREEVYSWNEFKDSWSETWGKGKGFNNPYGMLIATPPPETAATGG
jgi:hypothetical protein